MNAQLTPHRPQVVPTNTARTATDVSKISSAAARLAIASVAALFLLLASLHILSPEFDPSWRVISEYALGPYGWVLSLMFISYALAIWALAFTIRSQARTRAGRAGLVTLIAAGVGPATASMFAIGHPLHDVAGLVGVLGLPIAAMLTSVRLSRSQPWSASKKLLLWTANMTWVSVVLFIITLIVMFVTFSQAGGDVNAEVKALPPGVIALVGYANRLLVVTHSAWIMAVAWLAIKLRGQESLLRRDWSSPRESVR